MKRAVLSGALLVLSGMGHAQEGGTSSQMDASLAAGWKAAFTCSASFNGGLPLETIERNELDGIYPDFREAYAKLADARLSLIHI